MKLLVCGGMGFIGSAFIRNHLSKNPSDQIVNLDNLTTGSNVKNLEKIDESNYQFINGDIKNHEAVNKITNDIDVIVNFAAETHVDRSISNPKQFLETNILGTYTLLEAAKKHEKLFIHISTDELYGDAENQESFTEKSLLKPSNPYSATKAVGISATLFFMVKPSFDKVSCKREELCSSKYPISAKSHICIAIDPYFSVWESSFFNTAWCSNLYNRYRQ